MSSDKYHFRRVLTNVLMLPASAAWFYFLMFYVQPFWLVVLLAIAAGYATAYLLAWAALTRFHRATG